MTTKYWALFNCGLDIEMTLDQAESVSHAGRCDDDVAALLQDPEITAQLTGKEAAIRRELAETGAWDSDELADNEENQARIVWLAGNDIIESWES